MTRRPKQGAAKPEMAHTDAKPWDIELWTWHKYVLKPATRELTFRKVPVSIGPRAFDLLVTLVRRHGQVVSKRELLDTVWPKLKVEENNLIVQIAQLRRHIEGLNIQSVGEAGYCFASPVRHHGVNPARANRIFVSYRRTDSEYVVGRLVDDLRLHYEAHRIFFDLDSISAGTKFSEALEVALNECAAVLVVIGPNWLNAADRNGRQRLQVEDDWVRQEVSSSLSNARIRVFPLLIGGVEMPRLAELPEPMHLITNLQAYKLTALHWDQDVAKLLGILKSLPNLD